MRAFLSCLALTVFLCNSALAQDVADSHWITRDLAVRSIADGVWLHTTVRDFEGLGRVPSNGLLVVAGGEALLIDTAWGEAPTEALLKWTVDSLGLTVARAILTHGHDDRMGGIEILRQAGSAIVVPAHRSPGDAGLLDHTLHLLEAYSGARSGGMDGT